MTSNDLPLSSLSVVRAEAGRRGGQARTPLKLEATRANAQKARAAKLAYRLNPSLRPPHQLMSNRGD